MARENNEPAKVLIQIFDLSVDTKQTCLEVESFMNMFEHPYETVRITTNYQKLMVVLRVSEKDYENYKNVTNQDVLNNNTQEAV